MELILWFVGIFIFTYFFSWMIEFKRCTEEQRKHNEYWIQRGKKPFIDFCKHL